MNNHINRMGLFFAIVFVVYLLVNSYIFYRTRQALPDILALRIGFYVVFAIIFCVFFIAMGGRNVVPIGIQKILYSIGTAWLGVMLYLTLWFLLTDIVAALNHYLHFLPSSFTSLAFHRTQVIAGYLIVAIMLSIGYYRFTHPQIVKKEIVIHKDGGSHPRLRAVVLSDMHLGITVDKKKLKRYVDLINAQQPDLILIAGDLIDNNLRPLEEGKMHEELNRLNAPLGVYMSLGNHEYISGLNEAIAFIDKTNITLLKDRAVNIDHSFWLIGRDDLSNTDRLPIARLIEETDTSQPLILLDHQPYHLEEAEKNGIDLQVSGHTHAGQLWPLNYIVDAIYEVGHGYKEKGATHVYVSSGLGLWGPQFRIGTQSELIVFDITFSK